MILMIILCLFTTRFKNTAHASYLCPVCQNREKGGLPSPVACALVRLGHFLARVIWGRSTPYGPKYGLPKNALWVGTIQHRALQGHWTKLYRTCFA